MKKILEKRVFEGELGRENELRSDDPFIVTSREPLKLAWCDAWIHGLEGRRIRLTVEVLDEDEQP